MGGDEFAVIMLKDIEKIQQINEHFIKNLEEKRESFKKEDSKKKEEDRLPELPHISYGTAIYEPSNKKKQTLPDTQKLADAEMYANKEAYYEKNQKKSLKKMWTLRGTGVISCVFCYKRTKNYIQNKKNNV